MKAFSDEINKSNIFTFITWLLFALIMQAKYYAQDTRNQCGILGCL